MIYLCVIYFICSYTQTIPQIIKLMRTKSSHDYSLWTLAIQFVGGACWTLYIFTSPQTPIVYIGTAAEMLLLTVIDLLILKYYNNSPTAKKKRVKAKTL